MSDRGPCPECAQLGLDKDECAEWHHEMGETVEMLTDLEAEHIYSDTGLSSPSGDE